MSGKIKDFCIKHYRFITALFLYTLLTVAMTFPLIIKINHAIPGFFETNEPSIWSFWWLKYSHLHHLNSKFCGLIAYPFGVDISIIDIMYPITIFLRKLLVYATNPFLTYNIEIILEPFILSGLIMYLLARRLTGNTLASLFAGIIYSFCPYHFARAWQHTGLSHIEWFPLLLLGFMRLMDYRKIKISFFVILSILIIFSFDLYYAYFAMLILAAFIMFNIFAKSEFKKYRLINGILNSVLGVFVSLLVILPVLIKIIFGEKGTPGAWNAATRPFHDLFVQSAKPLSYLLPAAVHPVFGKFTNQFIGSPLYGVSYTEHTLYLGWIPLILAFIAFGRWRRRRKSTVHGPQSTVNEKEDFYIGFFIWLAVFAWVFSQPPYFTFPYFKIYMPSFFMYKIVPMFRAYCRFGVIVMLAVSVLAAFGLKSILQRFKSKKTRIAFTSLVCVLALFEFINFPPFKIIDLSKYPKVYDWLKIQKGDFVVAEYPLDTQGPHEYYRFCQTIHYKKLINGTFPGTYANEVAKTISQLSDPRTTRVLKWMGVKYVLVHLDAYKNSNDVETVNELNRLRARKIKGLAYVKDIGGIDVYEVTAQPEKPIVNE